MAYLNCPRCALSMRVRAHEIAKRHCPRCLARAGISIPLYRSQGPRRLDWPEAAPRPAAPPQPGA